MLSRENNMIRDDRETGNVLDPGMLIDEFWQTTVETASPAEIGPHCGHFLRAWNFLAIERMETEGRLTPADLATAKNSLRRFVQLMKTEAVFLGHPNRLDQNCFQAAHGRLERRSISTQFTLLAVLAQSRRPIGKQAAIDVPFPVERSFFQTQLSIRARETQVSWVSPSMIS
jgi:hypothetical protein